MRRQKVGRSRALWIGLFFAYFSVALAPAAHAYLDPGSGSLIFQVLIGGLLAIGVAVKAFWGRLRGALTRRPKPNSAEEPVSEKVD